VQYNFNHFLGIKAEFMGYGSTNFTIPAGTYSIQALAESNRDQRPDYNSGNMFTYLFGPVIRVPVSRVTPFGELLFGGSNSNAYGNQILAICNGTTCTTAAKNASGTSIPSQWRSEADLYQSLEHFSIRPLEIAWLLTRYTIH